jgi:hypothetical protein
MRVARGLLFALPVSFALWALIAAVVGLVPVLAFGGLATVGLTAWALIDGGRPTEPEPEPRYWATSSVRILRGDES